MSKSKEELNKLKEEIASVNEKLQELTPEELEQVNGGMITGAIAQVKDEDIAKLNTTDAASALQGKVVGVVATPSAGRPGSVAGIQIK